MVLAASKFERLVVARSLGSRAKPLRRMPDSAAADRASERESRAIICVVARSLSEVVQNLRTGDSQDFPSAGGPPRKNDTPSNGRSNLDRLPREPAPRRRRAFPRCAKC